MNRRSFFGRLFAAAAALVVAPKVKAEPSMAGRIIRCKNGARIFDPSSSWKNYCCQYDPLMTTEKMMADWKRAADQMMKESGGNIVMLGGIDL